MPGLAGPGGFLRCAAVGARDLRVAERRVFIAEGNGRHQRLVAVSPRFFAQVSAYLEAERSAGPDLPAPGR